MTMTTIPEWTDFAKRLHNAGSGLLNTAEKMPRPSKQIITAITLLVRTLSNHRAAILLLQEKHIVEARTITRCCYENALWLGRLFDEGEAFLREMMDDDVSHRKTRGQFVFERGLPLEADISARLRAWLKDTNKQLPKSRTLNPKAIAEKSATIGKTYLVYGQLSSDAAHPSLTSLNRYLTTNTKGEVIGIDAEPAVSPNEIMETFEFLCLANSFACVAVNQMLGGTHGGFTSAMADEFNALSNRTAANKTSEGNAPAA
jgi:uncharacterized protein DUF5677